MPEIYDNDKLLLSAGLNNLLDGAKSADFCVGYFNLKGWQKIEERLNRLSGNERPRCRILVGMVRTNSQEMKKFNRQELQDEEIPADFSNEEIKSLEKRTIAEFRHQLMRGVPDNSHQAALLRLKAQLTDGTVQVRLYGKNSLHAKLYLAHREDNVTALAGILGSSNLTLSGLARNDELNIKVTDDDATKKLSDWFENKWNQEPCIDLKDELIDILTNSWVGDNCTPYHIYIKTAYHLSKDAIFDANHIDVPKEFSDHMLDHQITAVRLASRKVNDEGGVIIGDVVGLGKTLVATAMAKIFQVERRFDILIICPPHLHNTWQEHIDKYHISAKILTMGRLKELEDLNGHDLVVIDEAHNLRNRESARHERIRNYIKKHNAKAVLLTATPYNKQYLDVGSLILLFKEEDDNLGIMPDNYISSLNGRSGFNKVHPKISPTSLAAFMRSNYVEDWKNLIQLYLVRRTRQHILKTADTDKETGRKYISYGNNKFYFPERNSRIMSFEADESNESDSYARLYSEHIVEIINSLELPRYGLEIDLKRGVKEKNEEDEKIMSRLNKAGKRLRGFARVGMFKRLESSGYAFLRSLATHVIKNHVLLMAFDDGEIFISEKQHNVLDNYFDDIDEFDKSDDETYSIADDAETEYKEDLKKKLLDMATMAYARIKGRRRDYSWLSNAYFKPRLVNKLENDNSKLMKILVEAGQWKAENDRKLDALVSLCNITHPNDKILVFSQFRHTIEYLHKACLGRLDKVNMVHGGLSLKETNDAIIKFSPRSNKKDVEDETRVLLTTDRLSEGVNLQDSHVVVNYDLPWAIINLIQRAGRVDRIGQQKEKIFCYSALPENGIENIINLRQRLNNRIKENHGLLSSEEHFFDDHQEHVLKSIQNNTLDLNDLDEGVTDVLTHAFEIWKNAVKSNEGLKNKIVNMPDAVHATRKSEVGGVIAFFSDNMGRNSLIQYSSEGQEVTRSHYQILKKLECEPMEPRLPQHQSHFNIIKNAYKSYVNSREQARSWLGTKNSVRNKVFEILKKAAGNLSNLGFEIELLDEVAQEVYDNILKANAETIINRQMRINIPEEDLIRLILRLRNEKKLFQPVEKSGEDKEPVIKCTMGLVASDSNRE